MDGTSNTILRIGITGLFGLTIHQFLLAIVFSAVRAYLARSAQTVACSNGCLW
jgi:hypothetical protein